MATELIKTEEIRSWAPARLKESEGDIRRQLAQFRMDLYQAPQAQAGNIRKLKVNLARIMTIKNESTKVAAKKKGRS